MPNPSIKFHELAREEIATAYLYYEREKQGLGDLFLTSIENLLDRIGDNPRQFPVEFEEARKAMVSTFPFIIIFTIIQEEIFIVSIFHTSQNPSTWQKRIQ